MKEAINEICITKRILEKFKISSIICWSENGFNEQIVIGLGQKMKKRIFLLQHGLYTDSMNSLSQNEFSGVVPRNSDNFLVWGDIIKKYSEDNGISGAEIKVIGSPSYDSILDERMRKEERGKYILIATTSTSNKIGDFLINNREKFEKIILSICKILQNEGKEIIIKIDVLQILFDSIYQYPNSKRLNITSFRKKAKEFLGARANVQRRCESYNNKPIRGIPVQWSVNEETKELLLNKFDERPNIS